MLIEIPVKIQRKVVNIIKDHNLSNTDARRQILALFLTANRALSHQEIEKIAGETLDRVTIYRTLGILLEHHILHSVPNNDSRVLYAICKHDDEEETVTPQNEHVHVDNHVHFACEVCKTVTCLETEVPKIAISNRYKVKNTQYIANGICNKCN